MSNNIFGNSKETENPNDFKEKVNTHSKAILTVVERQKDLESSLDLLNEKIELLDHNSIKNFKKIFNEIKDLKSNMRDIQQQIQNLNDFNKKVEKQLKLMTTKDEVTKIEKYVDLWNPMEFATRGELQEFREKIKIDIQKIVEKFIEE